MSKTFGLRGAASPCAAASRSPADHREQSQQRPDGQGSNVHGLISKVEMLSSGRFPIRPDHYKGNSPLAASSMIAYDPYRCGTEDSQDLIYL